MLISSNPMISVLHNIIWSVGINVSHKAKGKNNTSSTSKIGLPTACRADVALKHEKTGSSVNSPNEPWAVTGGQRAVLQDTSLTTSETMRCGRLLTDEMMLLQLSL